MGHVESQQNLNQFDSQEYKNLFSVASTTSTLDFLGIFFVVAAPFLFNVTLQMSETFEPRVDDKLLSSYEIFARLNSWLNRW